MQAKVKDDFRFSSTTACGGRLFTKKVWASVPVGMEAEAQRNEALETRPDPVEVVEPEVAQAEPDKPSALVMLHPARAEAKPKAKGKR